ncbi:hypothetical protein CDAR_237381 [Caerostris darwini]|uniref:Uncharacterized protein n=1 Tax=Caerostris darwini TaxID=1538125 RepID=A0AAV4QRV4_9ARAC|nr:hypothetical protein CDAR_237381 [Caerostris darwini]
MKHSLDGEWAKLRKNIAFIPFLSSSKDRFGVYFPPRTIFCVSDYRLQEDWNKSRKKATILVLCWVFEDMFSVWLAFVGNGISPQTTFSQPLY